MIAEVCECAAARWGKCGCTAVQLLLGRDVSRRCSAGPAAVLVRPAVLRCSAMDHTQEEVMEEGEVVQEEGEGEEDQFRCPHYRRKCQFVVSSSCTVYRVLCGPLQPSR